MEQYAARIKKKKMQLILSSHNDKKRRGNPPFEHMGNGTRKQKAVQGSIRYYISGQYQQQERRRECKRRTSFHTIPIINHVSSPWTLCLYTAIHLFIHEYLYSYVLSSSSAIIRSTSQHLHDWWEGVWNCGWKSHSDILGFCVFRTVCFSQWLRLQIVVAFGLSLSLSVVSK